MDAKLTFKYDRDADILLIRKLPPYPEQESEEIADDVIARMNPTTGEVECLEVLFFSTRLLRGDLFELPLAADCNTAIRASASTGTLSFFGISPPFFLHPGSSFLFALGIPQRGLGNRNAVSG